MSLSNSVVAEVAKNSILLISLHGVRTVLERELEIKNVLISSDESVKQQMKNRGETTYPYSYMSLSELSGVRDNVPTRTMQRFGARVGNYGATKATSRKAFMFPVTLGLDFKYVDNDPYRVITMAESLVILSQLSGFNFNMKFSDSFMLNIRLEVPESTTIPIADSNSSNEPGGMEVSLSLIVHTYAGFFREVSSVNSGNPIINYTIEMQNVN
jgi:hypothetical protein